MYFNSPTTSPSTLLSTVERSVREEERVRPQKRTSWCGNHDINQFLRFIVRTIRKAFHDGVSPAKLGVFVFTTDPVIDLLRGRGFYICYLEVTCL